jgi:predicted amidophosphoribosyltransferase
VTLPMTHTIVTCHCATYYSSPNKDQVGEARSRNDLVAAVKYAKKWSGGDQYQWFAEVMQTAFPAVVSDCLLVPVPTSAATSTLHESQWPALALAQAIASRDATAKVHKGIMRHTAIRKSSQGGSNQRPTVEEHRATLQIAGAWPPVARIVLVDDVLTRGTQFIACASLLADAGYGRACDAIALAYTRDRHEAESPDGRSLRTRWNGTDPYPERCQDA